MVACDVALHRVCIRTLMSRMWSGLSAGWGSRGESDAAIYGHGRQKRRRSYRNAVSMQRVNFTRLVVREGRMVPAWSKGDGGARPACEQPLRRTCSSPACHLWPRDEGRTVEVPIPNHLSGTDFPGPSTSQRLTPGSVQENWSDHTPNNHEFRKYTIDLRI